MNVASWPFALFTAMALGLYYLIPGRLQNPFLLVASYAYCASWSKYLPLMLLAVTVGTWFSAHRLRGAARLILGLGLNLGALIWLRTRAAPNGIVIGPDIIHSSVVPAIGMAFFTLQAIAYVIDAHLGRDRDASFMETALYLGYFPKFTAGPIERPDAFVAMLRRPRVVDDAVIAKAATLVALGLVRKLGVADVLFELARRGAGPGKPLSLLGFLAWGLVCFTALYADFAGYTDIVRGVSLLFGIELSPNFDRPLLAADAASFWSRWHMSLTAWLREYVYFPLSRALLRILPARHSVVLVGPPVATMIVCGLWHRFAFGAVAWGVLMGLLLALDASMSRRLAPAEAGTGKPGLGRLGTLAVIVIGSVPVLLAVAGPEVLSRVSGVISRSKPDLTCAGLVAFTLLLDVPSRPRGLEGLITSSSLAVRSGLLAAALLLLALTSSVGSPPFVYQGF